jgi:hypothetical protein
VTLLAEAKKIAEWLQTMLEGRPLSRMLHVDFGRQFIEPFLEAIEAEEAQGPSEVERLKNHIKSAEAEFDVQLNAERLNSKQVAEHAEKAEAIERDDTDRQWLRAIFSLINRHGLDPAKEIHTATNQVLQERGE